MSSIFNEPRSLLFVVRNTHHALARPHAGHVEILLVFCRAFISPLLCFLSMANFFVPFHSSQYLAFRERFPNYVDPQQRLSIDQLNISSTYLDLLGRRLLFDRRYSQ